MRELTKSVFSFSWAVSLLGARQLVGWARRGEGSPGQPLDAMTRAAEEQLDGSFRQAFEVGDRLQRSVVNLAWSCARPTLGGRLGEATTDVVQQSMNLLRRFLP